MSIAIGEDHVALAETVRKFAAQRITPDVMRTYEAPFWKELAALGFLGGDGFGFLETAIVLEELGRACAPGPALSTIWASALLRLAGRDDAALTSGDEIDGCKLRDGTDAVLRSLKIYKPIIAAVDGPCVAGGMEMLGGIDIRIATERAIFGVMEPKRGLFAGGGTTVRLPRQIPFPAAMEFLLTAEAFPASRCLELGLLNEIVPVDELADRAVDWARRINANAPLAVQATKESVLRGLAAGTQKEAFGIESQIAGTVFSSNDAKEGPKAFAEKRDPIWTGT